MIALRPINEENFPECLNLKATVEQERYVDPVTYSLAEAWVYYQETKPFAIYQQEKMVGFVSMYVGEGNHQIINFLIDDSFQRQGLGTQAARACIHFLQKEYLATRVSVPVEMENTAARSFCEKLGFQYSDSVEDGYVFMRLNLS